jgi:hypoxia up-regulated 1
MVLGHAVDISVAYAAEQGTPNMPAPRDVVLTVPSFATQSERRALLDAAVLADLNVLALVEENTAAAVHYAMDKTFENDQVYLFYNMGASALQVSLVRFYTFDAPQKYGPPKKTPGLEVLAKAWDETLGGDAFDNVLVEHFADQFNHVWQKQKNHKKDIREVPRAMTKFRLQAHKAKHVLSANNEIPVHVESVQDDIPLSTHVTRDLLEKLSEPLLKRVTKPIEDCLATAGMTWENVTAIELIGGGMRVPRIQQEISSMLASSMELGLHMNSDESMALGAAFVGANISTAFRVRQVGMTDLCPWEIAVSLEDDAAAATAAKGKSKSEEEAWSKQATLFKSWSKMGIKKTIAFTHDRDVQCSLSYAASDKLPEGTELPLEHYSVTGVADFASEMAKKGLGKPKVSLQFEMSQSGVASLVKAEAAVEETYMVEEDMPVNATEATNGTEAATDKNDTAESGENSTAGAEADKTVKIQKVSDLTCRLCLLRNKSFIYLTQMFGVRTPGLAFVPQEKKRLHKRSLSVQNYYTSRVQPHSASLFQASRDKLLEMAKKDKERMMLEEAKNKVEAYMYFIRNKLDDDEEALKKVSTEEEREKARQLADAASDWLDDEGYNADLPTMIAKYEEISGPFEKILFRHKESTARPEAIKQLQQKLDEVEALIGKWVTTKPQVTEEERNEVIEKVEEVRKWINQKEDEQAKKGSNDDPVYTSAEVPGQIKRVEALVLRLSRKPKPKVEKKASAASNDTTTTNATADDANNATADDTGDNTAQGATEDSATTETEGTAESASSSSSSGEGTDETKEDEL